MGEQRQPVDGIPERGAGTTLKRRGILAAAGAVVAGIVAKQTAQPVAAAVAVTLGGNGFTNVTTAQTTVRNNGDPNVVGTIGALCGIRSTDIVDSFGGNIGVYGVCDLAGGVGVRGSGQGNAIGVSGDTTSGIYGVYGFSGAPGGCGVRGDCTGGYGVLGSVSDGYGVLGQATTGNGVRAFSQQNHAVVAQTVAPFFGSVLGVATTANSVGIYGTTQGVASAFAGYMDGNFVVVHGVKSAAVPHPDGTHRLVYCVESPEAWFEDFGRGTLAGGKAEVRLDPEFMAVVERGQYHVFLTAYEGAGALRAVRLSGAGFGVEEIGGASNGAFSWRVVARRTDVQAARLAKFELVGKSQGGVLKPLDLPKPPPEPPSPPPRKP